MSTMLDIDDDLPEMELPFDARKQLAVLGHLLTNPKFFEQARHQIKPDWFNDPRQNKVYHIQLEFAEKNHRMPTVDELKSSQRLLAEKPEEIPGLKATIERSMNETSHYGLDVLRKELTQWLHARLYVESVKKSKDLYNARKYEACYELVNERIQRIRTTRFDDEYELSFDNAAVYLQQADTQYESALTTGFSLLDAALRPEGMTEGGGLFAGDTTVILAPSNVGKTTAMITIAVHNIKMGKHVLFMTHEGRPSDIREKFLQCLLGIDKVTLLTLFKTPEGLFRLREAEEIFKRFLTYIPYNKAGMTVEDVVPIIRRRQDERMAQNQGKGYDLLVSDYPAKLSTERAKNSNLAKRNIDEVIYDYYVQLALELNLHSLVAIQTNRQGSIANRDDERLLTMEDVLESWGVMTAATNVLTLNRNSEAASKGRLTWLVCKSRSSTTGTAVVSRTRYDRCISHSDELGGTSYKGDSSMSDRIEEMLEKYNGKAIPEGTIV